MLHLTDWALEAVTTYAELIKMVIIVTGKHAFLVFSPYYLMVWNRREWIKDVNGIQEDILEYGNL